MFSLMGGSLWELQSERFCPVRQSTRSPACFVLANDILSVIAHVHVLLKTHVCVMYGDVNSQVTAEGIGVF